RFGWASRHWLQCGLGSVTPALPRENLREPEVPRSSRDGLGPRERKGKRQRDAVQLDESSEWWSLKGQPAAYYRAAAARAQSLEAEATTPSAKRHLRELIEQCERLAEEAEEASRNL